LETSKTIAAPYLAGGLAADCFVQEVPSQLQVSPNAALVP
jgi:hypothetical protein